MLLKTVKFTKNRDRDSESYDNRDNTLSLCASGVCAAMQRLCPEDAPQGELAGEDFHNLSGDQWKQLPSTIWVELHDSPVDGSILLRYLLGEWVCCFGTFFWCVDDFLDRLTNKTRLYAVLYYDPTKQSKPRRSRPRPERGGPRCE